MKVAEPGHMYLLDTLDGSSFVQELVFVSRVGQHYPGNQIIHSGTTSQEVLRALIDRARYVNRQIPCKETKLSVWLLRAVIFLYEWRAKRVKGKRLPFSVFRRIEELPTCHRCGHVLCSEDH